MGIYIYSASCMPFLFLWYLFTLFGAVVQHVLTSYAAFFVSKLILGIYYICKSVLEWH